MVAIGDKVQRRRRAAYAATTRKTSNVQGDHGSTTTKARTGSQTPLISRQQNINPLLPPTPMRPSVAYGPSKTRTQSHLRFFPSIKNTYLHIRASRACLDFRPHKARVHVHCPPSLSPSRRHRTYLAGCTEVDSLEIHARSTTLNQ